MIANRGEIALRILRACREMGIETVCVYSEADAELPYLKLADRSICIGSAPARESYLNTSRLISAAEIADVDAIHPGYGFLAENAEFSEMCRDCRITFIGPSPEAMATLGDKVRCKQTARSAKVPVFPGSDGVVENEDEAVEVAERIGYPVMIKASAGGGGRGMRICRNEATLRTSLKHAQEEARASFSNGHVFIEKYLDSARHIEVQAVGDAHGHAIHLYDRDCSIQRRHQKLIEESPAPGIDRKRREMICDAAARLIRAAEYVGAATVEFLMDSDRNFYMLEVNTRVQVEHPVTEMVTGVDIVKLSILVAAGEPLPVKQKDVSLRGCSMECRINAEDPDRGFMPSPGRIETYRQPGGLGVRVDTHISGGCDVSPHYDSLIGKLIVHADDRAGCIARMSRSLREFEIGPIKTTIPLHLRLMENSSFRDGGVDIQFLERLLK